MTAGGGVAHPERSRDSPMMDSSSLYVGFYGSADIDDDVDDAVIKRTASVGVQMQLVVLNGRQRR